MAITAAAAAARALAEQGAAKARVPVAVQGAHQAPPPVRQGAAVLAARAVMAAEEERLRLEEPLLMVLAAGVPVAAQGATLLLQEEG